ncbi:MAG: IclR family transcriptional regulator [Propionibacteriales bacterium]|nr:IclR family transcriptional regulator [Propionibacteriales bacterium]
MTTRSRPVATVERAVAVLHALADAPGDLGNNEIARQTGINPSTVSRLLATLATDELVSRVTDSGRFRLGPRLVELGNAALARVDMRQLCHPHLVALTEATGETATLSVPYEEGTITVDFVQSPSSVRSVAQVGRPSVAHATSTGKVYLAYAGSLPTGPLPSYTKRTITDTAVLAAEVATIRHRGWAQAVGEREEDQNAVAAPIIGAGAVLTAVLGLQGPAGRFGPRAMRAAVEQLTAHCLELSTSNR